MDQVKKSVRALKEHPVLLLPIYIARLLPALLGVLIFQQISDDLINMLSVEEIGETQYVLENYGQVTRDFLEANQSFILASLLIALLGLLLSFVAVPATYGMARALLVNHEKPAPSDILPKAGKYFGRYLLFRICQLALWIFALIFAGAATGVLIFLGSLADQGLALLLGLLAVVFFFIAGLLLNLIIKLWFPGMVLKEIGVLEGLQQAFIKSKILFWPLAAGFLVIRILAWIANMIVGLFVGDIPYLDPLLSNVIPAIAATLLILFYMGLYLSTEKELVNGEESG